MSCRSISSAMSPVKEGEEMAFICTGGCSDQILEFFFTERMVRHWSEMLRRMVESLFLEVFKKNLDMALQDMV